MLTGKPIRMLVLAAAYADIKTESKYWLYRKPPGKCQFSVRSSAFHESKFLRFSLRFPSCLRELSAFQPIILLKMKQSFRRTIVRSFLPRNFPIFNAFLMVFLCLFLRYGLNRKLVEWQQAYLAKSITFNPAFL